MKLTRLCLALALMLPALAAAQQKLQLPPRDKILAEKPALVYSLGVEDGEDYELLSGVRAVAFDARDNLYVLDGNNYRVLVFDAAGKFVRRISRKGGGPGELMAPIGMTVTNDGTIVVADQDRRAFSLFKPDGTFLTNVLWSEDEGSSNRQSRLMPHPAGGIVAPVFQRVTVAREPGAPTGERKLDVKRIELAANAGAAERTVLYEFTFPSIKPKVENRGSGVSITTLPPGWSPEVGFGVLPNGGIAATHQAEYRITIVNAAGKVERVLERPIAPRKGTEKDKDAYVRRQLFDIGAGANGAKKGRNGEATTQDRKAALEFLEKNFRAGDWLDVVPVLTGLTTDPQGRIWAARTADDFGLAGPIDLVRANGTYIGTIPKSALPAAVSKSNRAAFVEHDDLGVEHVVVRRLPAAWQ